MTVRHPPNPSERSMSLWSAFTTGTARIWLHRRMVLWFYLLNAVFASVVLYPFWRLVARISTTDLADEFASGFALVPNDGAAVVDVVVVPRVVVCRVGALPLVLRAADRRAAVIHEPITVVICIAGADALWRA